MTVTVLINRIALLGLVFMAGCSLSGEPVPDDHYYRLPPVSAEQRSQPVFDDIVIRPVQVSGLYHERAMLYVEQSQPLEIRRYHYHYWVEPPAAMLTRYLRDSLQASGLVKQVRIEALEDAPVVIKPVLAGFERIITDHGPENRVALAFQVEQADGPDWAESYAVQLPAESASMHASAASFGQALNRVVSRFSEDLMQKSP